MKRVKDSVLNRYSNLNGFRSTLILSGLYGIYRNSLAINLLNEFSIITIIDYRVNFHLYNL